MLKKKIVIAPDSFKESLSAIEAANAIKEGLNKSLSEYSFELIPMADGGEGTCDVIVGAKNGEMIYPTIKGPLLESIQGRFGYVEREKLAVIEVADGCGMQLVPKEKRNPGITTTFGVGELIKAALNKGARNFIIGLGGSSTNDGGFGMLQALGAIGIDKNNNLIKPGGLELAGLKDINFDNLDCRLRECNIKVACDVENPLVGEFGASKVFAPQKGATDEMVLKLEEALINYGNVIKRVKNINIKNMKKAGAAGGLGSAFILLNAKLEKGIDIVLEYTNFEERIKDADYIFTGEGAIDYQTKYGKTISGISKLGKKYNIPVIALAGRVSDDFRELYDIGVTSIFSIMDEAKSIDKALQDGYKSLAKTSENIGRILKINE